MSSSENDALSTELRMRRALGLRTDSPRPPQQRQEPARQRHRFVQDGEVPVVVLGGDGKLHAASQVGEQVATLEAALAVERAAHASATRSLEATRATIQSLQTRLAHAELAFDEAIAGERRAREEAETALQKALAGGGTAEPPLAMAVGHSAKAPAKRALEKTNAAGATPEAGARPRKPEPRPVKWWLPSYRAKRQAR